MSRWLSRLDEFEGVTARTSERQATPVQNAQNAQKPFLRSPFEPIERIEQLPAPAGPEIFEERAAIIEHDARAPRAWAEGYARLCLQPGPPAIPAARWRALVDAAGRFLDLWGVQAAALGWEAADIFGCHPSVPSARYDLQGLIWLLGSGAVVAITDTTATIRQQSGAILTFRRVAAPPGETVVMVWELAVDE